MKINNFLVLFLVLYSIRPGDSASYFENLWPKKDRSVSTEIKSLPRVIYEIPEFDEKFLLEAEKLLKPNLDSEIDRCNQRVIMKLNRHCSELSSEQLGKLAVMLLNCQANVEGRRVFPCTVHMTLKECTSEMDVNIWNVYHQITNRAKAVCVTTRQEQFRGLTELTVNKLMKAAQSQLNMITELLDNQNRLSEINKINMDEINENDCKIKARMEEYQTESLNLAEKNKAFIQKEMNLREFAFFDAARRLHVLQTKMARVSGSLKVHEEDIHSRHSEIVKDVEQISTLMKDIVNVVNVQGRETLKLYNQTIEYMEELNANLAYLTNAVGTVKHYSEGFVKSFKEVGIDVKDGKFASIVQHVGNLVVGMLILVFLKINFSFRFLFVILMLLNAASGYYRNKETDLVVLNSVFVTIYSVYIFTSWSMRFLHYLHNSCIKLQEMVKLSTVRSNSIPRSASQIKDTISSSPWKVETPKITSSVVKRVTSKPQTCPVSSLTQNSFIDDSESADQEIVRIFVNQNLARDPAITDIASETSVTPYLDRPNTPYESRPLTPAMRRVMSESCDIYRSGTPFMFGMAGNRVQCQGLTKKGEQCKNAAVSGHIACRIHNK